MRSMKKLIAISLVVVMLFALAVPTFAWEYKGGNISTSTELIESAGKEIVINAGKLPEGTTVELNVGTSSDAWNYAYPYTLDKRYTPGQYADAVMADVYLMYDEHYLYVKEVRRHAPDTKKDWNPTWGNTETTEGITVSDYDASEYNIIASGVTLSTSGVKVGGVLRVTPKLDTTDAKNTAVANTVMLQTSTYRNNTSESGKAWSNNYTGTEYTVESYSRLVEDDCFEMETRIPWAAIGSGVTPSENMLLGFKHYINWGSGIATYHTINTLVNSTSVSYHNAWDHFAPLYLRATDAKASEQLIDTSWYKHSETTTSFNISTAGQLRGLSYIVNQYTHFDTTPHISNGGANARDITRYKTFNITNDIDLNPNWSVDDDGEIPPLYVWYDIGVFTGKINGNGFTISGMYADDALSVYTLKASSASNAEFFFDIRRLGDGQANGNANSGNGIVRDRGFIARVGGGGSDDAIKNIVFKNSKVVSNSNNTGGLIGYNAESIVVNNVYTDIDVEVVFGGNGNSCGNSYAGGIIGKTGNTVKINNVVYAGNMDVSAASNSTGCSGAPISGGGANNSTGNVLNNILVSGTMKYGSSIKSYELIHNQLNGETVTATNAVVLNPENSSTYPAGWVAPNETAKVGETTVKMPASVAAMVGRNVWVQKGTSETNNKLYIRILTVVDTLEWEKFGWKIEFNMGDGNGYKDYTNDLGVTTKTTVYGSVTAAGELKTATDFGGKYIAAEVLNNIPANATFKIRVTPQYYVEGVETPYNARPAILTVVNGVLQ